MKRKLLYRLPIAFACGVALLVLAGLLTLRFLDSAKFQDAARGRIISALETATGSPVELRRFHLDWRTFTADARDLVIHGVEPASAAPLLHVPALTVELDWRSLLGRRFAARNILIVHPQLRLLLYADGSTNLPKLGPGSGSFLNNLFDLHVSRYEIREGAFAVNEAERDFSVTGENLRASLEGFGAKRVYRFAVSTRQLVVKARCCEQWPVEVTAHGTLQPNLLRFDSVRLQSRETQFEAAGSLRDFARPVADFHFRATTTAAEIRAIARLDFLRQGVFAVGGEAHFEQPTGLTYDGRLQARQVAYASPRFRVAGVSADSDFQCTRDLVRFTSLHARLLGGEVVGQATLQAFHSLEFTGRATKVELDDVVTALGAKRLPWRARLNGKVEGDDASGLRAELTLQPVSPDAALSGHLNFTVHTVDDLRFTDSRLSLPRTNLVFSGSRRQGFAFALESHDLHDLQPVWDRFGLPYHSSIFPVLLSGGSASLSGTLRGPFSAPIVAGRLALSGFRAANHVWDRLQWQGSASPDVLVASSFSVDAQDAQDAQDAHAAGAGRLALHRWSAAGSSPLQLDASFRGLDLGPLLASQNSLPAITRGRAGGTLALSGTVAQPEGQARLRLANIVVYGETIPRVRADVSLASNRLRIERGVLSDRRGDDLSFSGDYRHAPGCWNAGEYSGVLNSERFEISHVDFTRKLLPSISGTLAIHTQVAARVSPAGVTPLSAQGTLRARNIALAAEPFGDLSAQLETQGENLKLALTGDVRGNDFSGSANLAMNASQIVRGDLEFGRVPLTVWRDLLLRDRFPHTDLTGFAAGTLTFEGPLNRQSAWHAAAHISELEASREIGATPFKVRNAAPLDLEYANDLLRVDHLDLRGRDTAIALHGSLDTRQPHAVNLDVNGSLDLQVLDLFDAELQASGAATVRASVRGTLANPNVTGDLSVANGSVIPRDFSNGLSAINGTLSLQGDRATIRSLTARAGGGELTVGGFMTLGGAAPLAYHLDARAANTRLRSASGISVTGDATLRLTGASASTLLSGSITVSRIVFTPTTDVGNLLAGFAASKSATQTAVLPGFKLPSVQLNVAIRSAPNLQVNTTLSRDIGADIDLQLRGVADRPVLLGSVTADQGEIRVFGARYTINRGDVSFLNPTGIDPVLDLDLQTEARGINVDITISGTLDRLNVNYRSDPPLQPRDIIALLAVGRTPQEAANVQSSQVNAGDVSALQAGASSLLSQAISPPSNRLSKLFGVTNIKLDPLVQGITSTPESRLTLEQQISRAITVTYVTNLEQTSEQIFRLEWAISREYSVVAVRDDNGEFGIDIQYKRRFK